MRGTANGDGPVVIALEEAMAAAHGPVAWGGFDERAPCGLCFTSGTTGAPKGVTYTHRSSFLHTLRLLQADVIGITAADSVLAVVPMFHANAWGLPFAVPAAGAKLVLPGRHADGASLARLIAAEAVTIAVGVPTVWLGLVEHLEATGGELPSLERIMVGGAPLPPALMERIEQRLGVYGADELGHDRAVAVGHDVGAERSAAIRRGLGPPGRGRGSSADGCRGTAAARAARCRGASARARRERDRALLRR